MKRQAIVDAPDVILAIDQAVTALAVGVVDDDVEGGHPAKVFGASGHQRKVMLAEVGDDELLHRPRSQWSVSPIEGEGYDLPAERLADQVGSNFALAQRAVGEVVQWHFARARLVDGESFHTLGAVHLRQIREV